MEIVVAGPIFTQENIAGSMQQVYRYVTKREKNIVAALYIYGASSILLLFCDHQDTESESYEM